MLGTLLLLNPGADLTLKRGQSAVLTYKAVNGPVTVEVSRVPGEIGAALPDQTVSLLEGEQVALKITDKALANGQQAAPVLRLNDQSTFAVPRVTGRVVRPFPWWWVLLGLLALLLLWLLVSRARRPFTPYALSVDRRLRVFLHDRQGTRRSRWLRRDSTDLGTAFREGRLGGLSLGRYRPDITPGDEVLLDNSDVHSLREYGAQQLRRAARLQAQPDTLRLQKDGQPDGTFLAVQETLTPGLLYLFTDYVAPPVRVRPPMPPAEPPIEVIVTLLSGTQMQELELPLEDVDLADVFAAPALRGLVVRREPGLLRLRSLAPGMELRHISREFRPGDALPLAVMLTLAAPGGAYQVRVRDRAAATAADALALGDRVLLSPGQDLASPRGLGLLAHELTHVLRERDPGFVPLVARESVAQVSVRGADRPTAPDAAPGSGFLRTGGAAPQGPSGPARPPRAAAMGEEALAEFVEAQVRQEVQRPARSAAGESPWGGLPAPWEPMPFWDAPAATAPPGQARRAPEPAPGTAPGSGGPAAAPPASSAPAARLQTAQAASTSRSVDSGAGPAPAASPLGAAVGSDHRKSASPPPDLDRLAQQVYGMIKQRLATETRRNR